MAVNTVSVQNMGPVLLIAIKVLHLSGICKSTYNTKRIDDIVQNLILRKSCMQKVSSTCQNSILDVHYIACVVCCLGIFFVYVK